MDMKAERVFTRVVAGRGVEDASVSIQRTHHKFRVEKPKIHSGRKREGRSDGNFLGCRTLEGHAWVSVCLSEIMFMNSGFIQFPLVSYLYDKGRL
jgi:hypothetical protein